MVAGWLDFHESLMMGHTDRKASDSLWSRIGLAFWAWGLSYVWMIPSPTPPRSQL